MPWQEIGRWVLAIVAAFAGAWLIFAFPILIFLECRKIARLNQDRNVSGVWVLGSIGVNADPGKQLFTGHAEL